ncbi:MAG: hypothetical protein V1837_01060 [Candidatus Woesearchaeota archaeon]
MKNIVYAIAVILVLAGCTTQQANPPKAQPFVGGIEGVNVAFSADSPPQEVDDGGQFPFDVVVELRNKGEHTIPKEEMTVKIMGVRPEEFGKTESELTKHPDDEVIATIKDPEGFVTEGPPVFVTFSNFNHEEHLVGNKDFIFRVEACYKYQTTAMAQLCVRKNNIDPEKNGVCEPTGDKIIQNSGGPVQVTDFKEFGRAKNKVGFQFTIEHKGTGNIFQKGSDCAVERKYENRIFVKVKTDINSGMTCSGLDEGDATSGYIKLFGVSRIVSCTQEVTSNSDYETPVIVDLTYDYRNDAQTVVLVKHIPEED